MKFIKKQKTGFYLSAVLIITLLIALIGYGVNVNTNYFVTFGVNYGVIICSIVALLILVALIILEEFNIIENDIIIDFLYVICGILISLSTMFLLIDRVYNIATIMTFENTASTMADLESCIVSIVFYIISLIICFVNPFFGIKRKEEIK